MQEIVAILLIIGAGIAAFPKKVGAAFTGGAGTVSRIDPAEVDTVARTIWGEARGEGYKGMQSVANVIMNRYKAAQASTAKARQFGATPAKIARKPYQFSAWNYNDPNLEKVLSVTKTDPQFRQALEIAERALSGTLPDITGGADHYHTRAVNPSWSKGQEVIASIGSHNFFKLG